MWSQKINNKRSGRMKTHKLKKGDLVYMKTKDEMKKSKYFLCETEYGDIEFINDGGYGFDRMWDSVDEGSVVCVERVGKNRITYDNCALGSLQL
ncbi:MAG: hypothetical protein ACRCX2_27445, partial [Paraclostridium sp.]